MVGVNFAGSGVDKDEACGNKLFEGAIAKVYQGFDKFVKEEGFVGMGEVGGWELLRQG